MHEKEQLHGTITVQTQIAQNSPNFFSSHTGKNEGNKEIDMTVPEVN